MGDGGWEFRLRGGIVVVVVGGDAAGSIAG